MSLSNQAKTAVIIASTGRPDELHYALSAFGAQTEKYSQFILSVVTEDDLPRNIDEWKDVDVVFGPKGAPAQRNTGLRAISPDADIIAFFDDDYLPSRYCIERISRFFAENPNVVGANGTLWDDGINSPGIDPEVALATIRAFDATPPSNYNIERDLIGLYGCNMAFRASATAGIWFDERLKLYGWQEDIDFSTQVSKLGRLVKTDAFHGIHLGTKRSRSPGVNIGYSQVINPLYLVQKGTMPRTFGLKLLARNLISNHVKALRPEPWVDRRGRVKGNWIGILDALQGKLTPERIESFG